jgi:hypothetical protein
MRSAVILKFVLIGGLLVAGTLFQLKGLGMDISVFKYKNSVAHWPEPCEAQLRLICALLRFIPIQ